MPLSAEELQAQVLALPDVERAALLDLLEASFDSPVSVEREWMELADRRRQDFLDGKAEMVPDDEVLARIRARYL